MTELGQSQSHTPIYLEPRVAKLEVGMERLTDDVRNLAIVVREQGNQVEQEIQKLVVAVTQAAGPRKTEWSTIIAAAMLVLAIGAAAFWPLNQTVQEQKVFLSTISQKIEDHSKIENHPVGVALINRLEYQIKDVVIDKNKNYEDLKLQFRGQIMDLERYNDQKLQFLTEKMNLHDDRLYNRVVALESRNLLDDERERDELDKWRQRAMGLSGPSTSP